MTDSFQNVPNSYTSLCDFTREAAGSVSLLVNYCRIMLAFIKSYTQEVLLRCVQFDTFQPVPLSVVNYTCIVTPAEVSLHV